MTLILRPSAAYRWTRCAAAPTFEARSPEQPPSDAAREGTAAAWVADCVLKGDADSAEDMNGETHSNGWLITPDMCEHVQNYIDMIKARGGVTTTEQFVRLTDNIAGTLDAATSYETGTLDIDDLKYGHQIVEVFDNTQCLIYGAAELLRLGLPPQITHVKLGIYQPRAFHPDGIYRTWTMPVAELWERIEWIIARGNECLKPNPVATPGPQCDHCNARTSCFALAASNYRNYQMIEDHRQRTMTAQEAATEWLFLEMAEKLIKTRKSALDAEIEQRMKKEHFPGIHMKTRKGHRKFDYDPLVIQALTGISPYVKVLMSPPDMERAGVPVKIVNALASAPDIGHKLERLPNNHFEKVFKK